LRSETQQQRPVRPSQTPSTPVYGSHRHSKPAIASQSLSEPGSKEALFCFVNFTHRKALYVWLIIMNGHVCDVKFIFCPECLPALSAMYTGHNTVVPRQNLESEEYQSEANAMDSWVDSIQNGPDTPLSPKAGTKAWKKTWYFDPKARKHVRRTESLWTKSARERPLHPYVCTSASTDSD
jgi:hypothetical protein